MNRGKQHIVVVHPHEYGLAMVQLHYHDQIRPFSAVEFERESVSEKEIELAVQLVRAQAHDAFDARQYTDEVRERLLDLIRRKEEGADITALATVEPARDNTIDLIATLKASIEATATRQPAAAPPARSKSRKKSA